MSFVLIGVLGLLIGSFLNVVALRWSRAESIVRPPSHCRQCKRRLTARELIPVVSYLWQKGRCRQCDERISGLYPAGELLTCLLFLLMYGYWGPGLELLAALLLSSALVVALVADLATGIIPFKWTIPTGIAILVVRLFTAESEWWRYGLAAALMLLLFMIIQWLYSRIGAQPGRHAFGGGDVVLFMVIATACGLKLSLLCLFLSSVFGILFYLLGIGRSAEDGSGSLRFAPAMLPAAVISYLWGEQLLALYFQMLPGT